MAAVGALDRKLLRDLWRLRGQVLSIALVVAAGIATVVVFRSTFDSLEAARDRYYRENRFAHVFASLKRAPEPVAARIAALPGVDAVETRVVVEVTLDVPGLAEPATGRILSLPTRGEPLLNRPHLVSGRMPHPGRSGEVVVGEHFADANRLGVGDSLGAVVNGRWERLRIVGVAISPEFVYPVQPGAFLTDDRRFGVLWMDRAPLGAAYRMEGAFNDLSLTLAPGASEPATIAAVDRILHPYGGFGAYGRADQLSNRTLSDEFRQNRATGTLIPALILGVAAFLLNVVLGRMVATEREQIAVLKAFGYSDLDVGRHYLRFALAAVLLGAAIGIGAGVWMGGGMIQLYAEYFRFPDLRHRASWLLVAAAVGVSALAAGIGALGAVRRAVRLPPAEAMRPEAPARFARGWVERALPRGSLSPSGRIVLRNLTRRPGRTVVSVLGVALAISLLLVTMLFFDSFRFLFDHQFGVSNRQSLTVVFNAPRAEGARHDLAAIPGVERVEPYRTVPVRIRSGHRVRQLGWTGSVPDPALARVVDRRGRPVPLPDEGVLLSRVLAAALGVAPGDTVLVEVLEGARPVLRLPVSGTVDDVLGISAHTTLAGMSRLLGEGHTLTGAHLSVRADRVEAVNEALKRMPLVAGVSSPGAMLRHFRENIAENLLTNLAIVAVFAGIIAIGVVYNGARIALSERGRELASLRVLGFTRHEVAVILLGEQGAVAVMAIPAGWALGVFYCWAWIRSLEGEVYRIPMVVHPASFVIAAAIVLAMAALAGAAVRRRLAHLDLIGVLKTRE